MNIDSNLTSASFPLSATHQAVCADSPQESTLYDVLPLDLSLSGVGSTSLRSSPLAAELGPMVLPSGASAQANAIQRIEPLTHQSISYSVDRYRHQPDRYTQSETTRLAFNHNRQANEFLFEQAQFSQRTSSLAAPSLLLLAHSDALVSKPARLTFGAEFDQLGDWSMSNPSRRLSVIYRDTLAVDQSGVSKHALTASFSTVATLPILRKTPEGYRLVPLDEIHPLFPNRGLVNRNVLRDCAKLGHLFARLLAQNGKVKKAAHLKIDLEFSASIYHALALLGDVTANTRSVLDKLVKIAKQPEKAKQLRFSQLLHQHKTHPCALALLNQVQSLGLEETLKRKPKAHGQTKKNLFQRLGLAQRFSQKHPLSEQIQSHLAVGLLQEGDSEETLIVALAEKFAPYIEMAKNFNAVLESLNLSKVSSQVLMSTFHSTLNFKQWFDEDPDAFVQAFKITGAQEQRKQDPKIDELIHQSITAFFKNNPEKVAIQFAHFVTASQAITKDTQVTLALHGDATYDLPQAHTCANQLDAYIELFKPAEPNGTAAFEKNLLLALAHYQQEPFGLR